MARLVLLAGLAIFTVTGPALLRATEGLDASFAALEGYDWGQDRAPLAALERAVARTSGDPAASQALEARLAGVLQKQTSRAAKDFACRQLSLIGTATAVPALALLLPDTRLSHSARCALERIPAPEAAAALRAALAQTDGPIRRGVLHSLAARRDAASVPALVSLLEDADLQLAAASAAALGAIATPEAARALLGFQKKAPEPLRLQTADALLCCAERLLAASQRMEAMALYRTLTSAEQPKHIRLAAMRGVLAVTSQKAD